jgi:hypothetical protein
MEKDAMSSVLELIGQMRSEWSMLVSVTCALLPEDVDAVVPGLAAAVKIGPESIKRKMDAILYAKSLGHSVEDISEMGQERVVSDWNKSRRVANYQETVVMKWSVPGSQRELVQEQERRVKRILGIQTSEQFFDWWLAQMTNATDEEIKDSAGAAK